VFLKRRFRGAVKKKNLRGNKESGTKVNRPPPVNEKKVIQRVWALAETLCESEGLELIQVEYQRESAGRILRLYIDKPGGINLDDCVGVSRQMGDILDVHLQEAGPYNLEVTSPGPDRPLAKKEDFKRFKGSRVKIKTNQRLNGQKNFTGVLLGISDDQVKLQIDEQVINLSYEDISKARLVE
jgi:ribosome maturation factor RimP